MLALIDERQKRAYFSCALSTVTLAKGWKLAMVLPVTLAFTIAISSAASPANTIRELWPALTRCWHAPENSTGSQITIVFSLTNDGKVLGKPRISYSKLIGTPEAQKTFIAAVLGALTACTPVSITPSLGGALAGRPLSLRFIGGPKGTAL